MTAPRARRVALADALTALRRRLEDAAAAAGRDPAGIVAIADYQLAAPARRAPFTALANHLLRIRGLDRMMTWRDGLARFIESRRAAQGGEP